MSNSWSGRCAVPPDCRRPDPQVPATHHEPSSTGYAGAGYPDPVTGPSSSNSNRYQAAAVCTPGLEAVCMAELADLGIRSRQNGPGVIEFTVNARSLYAANVWLRTANRVVVRVATFRATDFPHLQDHAMKIDWSRWVAPGLAPRFRVSSNESKLFHTKAVAQRLHQVSLPPSLGEPEQLFIVRIERNTVTISVDASGEGLHHRPWRTRLGDAPLRTTMAAAALRLSHWDPASALVDPFCGSGTIAIEAALIRRGLPPGGEREFAFHQWPCFEPGAWASVAGEVQDAWQTESGHNAGSDPDTDDEPTIIATDRDPVVIEAARANAEAAEVADMIAFDTRVVSHLRARADSGMVLTNPPYGKRMGRQRMVGLYRRLGAVTRERLPLYGLGLITSDRKLATAADSGLRSAARFRHGGLPVQLYVRPADQPDDASGSGQPAQLDSVAD